MHRPLMALAALGLAACTPPKDAQQPQLAANCDKSVTNVVAFTSTEPQDIVETRAFGATCDTAVVVIAIRDGQGKPLWAWASSYAWADRGQGVTPEAMDAFLTDWGKVNIDTTAALPEWPERAIFADELGAFMETPYDREVYNEIRAKAYPRLCHATGIESGVCIYFDPQSNIVAKIFESGA